MATARLEDFDFEELLGHGSFCQVERVVREGRSYAAKRVVKSKPWVLQAIRMEAHCLRRLQGCPEVVGFFYEVDTAAQWLGVLELCAVELWDVVRHCGCVAEEARWYGRRMAQAILVLHGHGIVHRDVKCENFMLTEGQEVKLIDFGTARDFQHPEVEVMLLGPQYEHHVGTPNFMAPEAIEGKANDQRSDLWSLGAALLQLLLGAPPFNAPTQFLILTKAQRGHFWLPSLQITEAQRDLFTQLLQLDPAQRLGARASQELLSHPALASCPRPAGRSELHLSVARLSRALLAEVDAGLQAEAPPAPPDAGEAARRMAGDEVCRRLLAAAPGDQAQVAEELLARSVELAAQRIRESQETLQLEATESDEASEASVPEAEQVKSILPEPGGAEAKTSHCCGLM